MPSFVDGLALTGSIAVSRTNSAWWHCARTNFMLGPSVPSPEIYNPCLLDGIAFGELNGSALTRITSSKALTSVRLRCGSSNHGTIDWRRS
ncbi:MAG: hypothetical protein ACJZ4L_11765 [Candidatus Poriferisodalaceae bacterium]